MKKRLIMMGIMICCLFIFTACQSESNSEAIVENSNSEEEILSEEMMEESTSEEEEPYISDFEPKIIYDQDGVVVTAKEYYIDYDEFAEIKKPTQKHGLGPVIEFEIVNKSEYQINLSLQELFIDEICYEESWCDLIYLDEDPLNNYANVCYVDPGVTKTVCIDWGQQTYFYDEYKDTMNVSIGLYLIYNYTTHYTDMFTFNTIYQDSNYYDRVQFDYNNIVYENDDVILYLVSATVEEGYNGDDPQDDTLSCVFLAESKIFDQPAEGTNAVYFGISKEGVYENSALYLVEQQVINCDWGQITGKAFLAVKEYNISWDDLQNQKVYFIRYEEAMAILTQDEYISMDYDIIEEGTIEIPISELTYIQKE